MSSKSDDTLILEDVGASETVGLVGLLPDMVRAHFTVHRSFKYFCDFCSNNGLKLCEGTNPPGPLKSSPNGSESFLRRKFFNSVNFCWLKRKVRSFQKLWLKSEITCWQLWVNYELVTEFQSLIN